MTDKELLKLAASAAEMMWIDDRETGLTIQRAEGAGVYNYAWNPLFDDGDALRLASALEIDVLYRVVGGERVLAVGPANGTITEFYRGNRVEMTRRAIVRAAAEMGKARGAA